MELKSVTKAEGWLRTYVVKEGACCKGGGLKFLIRSYECSFRLMMI